MLTKDFVEALGKLVDSYGKCLQDHAGGENSLQFTKRLTILCER